MVIACRPLAQTTTLPTGQPVKFLSKRDLPFLFKEIHLRRCYLRHGVALPRGGTVVDVGANIGLFATFAADELGPEGLVLSCEPLPPTYDCLAHNVAAHRRWRQQQAQAAAATAQAGNGNGAAAQQLMQHTSSSSSSGSSNDGPAPIVALNVGVGDGASESADFTFYPRAAGWSSMRPDGSLVMADMAAFLQTAFDGGPTASAAAGIDPVTGAVGRALRRWAPAWLYEAAWRGAVSAMMGGARQYSCSLTTVSQLIRQHQLGAVDLLKVDVERAELDVLRGVEDCHWPMIRQAALEVHECQLDAALDLLRHRAGFSSIVTEQDATLAGSSLHAVYCTR